MCTNYKIYEMLSGLRRRALEIRGNKLANVFHGKSWRVMHTRTRPRVQRERSFFYLFCFFFILTALSSTHVRILLAKAHRYHGARVPWKKLYNLKKERKCKHTPHAIHRRKGVDKTILWYYNACSSCRAYTDVYFNPHVNVSAKKQMKNNIFHYRIRP